ncbi:MAG: protein-L-isoaspartate(D-aspartate) O-methyltransferase [Gemmatimonadota bacterium]
MSAPDRTLFIAAARRMVREQLEGRGIGDPRVLEAMAATPREAFAAGTDGLDPSRAYADTALPVDRGQTLSQPYMVAAMTEALAPMPGSRVLEIGTGTGYQTAVLAKVSGHIWTIERDPVLAREATTRLAEMGVENVDFRVGDGTLGWPEAAPFEGILVTAAAPSIPDPLLTQLAVGGRMIIPVGSREVQELLLVEKNEEGIESRALMECRFVPLVGEEGWRPDGGRTPPAQ